MKFPIFIASIIVVGMIESKPLERANNFEAINEIDHGKFKSAKESSDFIKKIEKQLLQSKLIREKVSKPIEQQDSEDSKQSTNDSVPETDEKNDVISEGNNSGNFQQFNPFAGLLLPLLQRLQFSPQIFFQDRINQLKESLGNLGLALTANNETTAKQFATANGILHLLGPSDSGFYTDRLEPAGLLGGNGWFANKGGILGGPGAIISTGSLLTDYPTPY